MPMTVRPRALIAQPRHLIWNNPFVMQCHFDHAPSDEPRERSSRKPLLSTASFNWIK